MTSVIIPAHNEAGRIGANLSLLTAQARPGEFDIIVVANGCTDATAAVARSITGVRVLELATASKAAALRAGDAAAGRLTRIYLDADTALTTAGARTLSEALRRPGCCAATGRRRIALAGAGLLVRAFYAVNRRLPAYAGALYGRGVIALNAAGRARFADFPDVIADDLFLDSLFTVDEKHVEPTVVTTVCPPRRAAHLVRRLARVRAGNRALRGDNPGVRPARPSSWLRDVVLPRPWLWPAGCCYAAIVLAADLMARRDPTWEPA